jgi:phosphocarrier protein FPr
MASRAVSFTHHLSNKGSILLYAPLSGVVVPLAQVPDPVFAQRMVGDGVAIDPTTNEILSPFDGKISQLHPSNHAVAIRSQEGIECLIHIGIDTIKLKGQGFFPLVSLGDQVKTGQPLIRFDADRVAQNAKSLITLVLVTNTDEITNLKIVETEKISVGEALLGLEKKRDEKAPHLSDVSATVLVKSDPIEIKNPLGLHARPAALLTSLAKRYESELILSKGNVSSNVRSLVGIMGLQITRGDRVTFEARGSDAKQAIEALVREVQSGLGESTEASVAMPETPKETPRPKVSANLFSGVTAAPGASFGKIFQLRTQDAPVKEKGESPTQETERLYEAIRSAKLQLDALVLKIKSRKDTSQAMIFAAHQELLDDPSLLAIAAKKIAEGKSAGFAWKSAYTEIATQLEGLNNQLLAARANDVRDVGQRVLHLMEGIRPALIQYPADCILIAEDLTPSDVAALDRNTVKGLVTTTGGSTSHVAILARSLDIPALAGVDPKVLTLENGTPVILDSTQRELRVKPSSEEIEKFQSAHSQRETKKQQEHIRAREPATTLDGRHIEIVANIKATNEADGALQLGAEGVGLFRTEFLFINRSEAPTELEQLEFYQTLASKFGKRPLIIRTLDVGGDKPLHYLPIPKEENPFLGERGIRVSLSRQEIFRTQLRAILRAAEFGNVHIMFPMISNLTELLEAKAILEEERKKLNARRIPIGIMVEVPSVCVLAEHFAKEADFFSIGSNDLTQYTLAIDRGHPKLASQVDGLDPSVLRFIDMAVRAAHKEKKWVGVCGGIAGDSKAVPILLGLGVDELSISVPAIPNIKAIIRRLNQKDCEKLAEAALKLASAEEVRSLIDIEE